MQKLEPIVFVNANDAGRVVERLRDLLKNYGFVTVSDLFDLIGIKSTFVNEKWGWTNLDGIEVVTNREDEVLLKMPDSIRNPPEWKMPPLPPKPPTMDELLKIKAAELQVIYDNRTAGDKTFEGFLYDFTKAAVGAIASEILDEFLFGKKK